ncbi:MAG TPA: cytosolic protein [Chloroflexota bacterium]|nr:cytosolic protein [Chloroflexota bacterium]
MFIYYYRLFDRYQRPVASLAILGDEHPRWRPHQFEQALWNCQVQFVFPIVKLLDYRMQVAALETNRNPFAAILLAHLGAQQTRGDATERLAAKFAVLRRLYDLGYNHREILRLYRLIDWLMRLPPGLERRLLSEMEQFEEVRRMPYVTSAERIGIEKGIQQGLEQGLEQGREQGLGQGREQGRREGLLAGLELALRLKFGTAAEEILPEIRQLTDPAVIQAIYAQLAAASTVEVVRRLYRR